MSKERIRFENSHRDRGHRCIWRSRTYYACECGEKFGEVRPING